MTTPTWIKTWSRFERALTVQPASYATLMAVTGWTRPTVQKYLDTLREEKRAHVAAWGNDSRGHPVVPLFAMGNKPDVPRPGNASTSAMRMRRMRERQRAEA